MPKLLECHRLQVDDIDLQELNEAFAVQMLLCQDRLGIPDARLNEHGGAIALGHPPYGATGARMTRLLPREGKRRSVCRVVATMCISGGQGAAALFEIH